VRSAHSHSRIVPQWSSKESAVGSVGSAHRTHTPVIGPCHGNARTAALRGQAAYPHRGRPGGEAADGEVGVWANPSAGCITGPRPKPRKPITSAIAASATATTTQATARRFVGRICRSRRPTTTLGPGRSRAEPRWSARWREGMRLAPGSEQDQPRRLCSRSRAASTVSTAACICIRWRSSCPRRDQGRAGGQSHDWRRRNAAAMVHSPRIGGRRR